MKRVISMEINFKLTSLIHKKFSKGDFQKFCYQISCVGKTTVRVGEKLQKYGSILDFASQESLFSHQLKKLKLEIVDNVVDKDK